MATSITWPPIGGGSYSIPAAGEVGWPSLSNFLIALQNAQGTEAQKIAVRTATTTPITVASSSDCVIRVELSVPGASAVTLPAGVDGQYFVIVDGLGDASTNNITITANGAETINGQSSLVIDADYGAYALCFKSSNWTVVGSFGATGAGSVPRSDIAPGSPDYVVINNNLGELSEEQYLSQSRGGMGTNVAGFSGVVKAAAGVFSAATIVDADISGSAAIDATKLGLGNVDNTELSYLNGATSNIQNQINSITGAGITALTGDVTATGPGSAAATIANGAVTDAKVASGIDAAKIANGSVSNTEFQYLDGVTSLIQTQIDGKQPLDADLTAIAGLSSTGLIARTGAGTASARTITGTTNLITVTAGDGVSGNPTITVGSNVVTLTGTQALTNKDYDGGTASNSSRLTVPKAAYATLAALTRKEGTLVYATDQDLLYADDGSNLIPVGSGTGIGLINITDNPIAAASTTGWTAATNYTVTRDTSNSPLAGVIDTCFAISTTTASSESSTSGVYAAAQLMPAALRNTKTQVSIYANIPATSLGVWRLSVYNASGTRMSLASDSSGVTTLPGGFNGQFVTTFDADSSASYTASLTQTTRTSANTLYVTNISIGNGITAQGAAVSEWQSYPLVLNTNVKGLGGTAALGAQTSSSWRRVGSELQWRGGFNITGAGAGATEVTLVLPLNLTIDTSKFSASSTSGVNNLGSFSLALATFQGSNAAIPSSSTEIRFLETGASTLITGADFVSGSQCTWLLSIPIAEWSGNGTVNLGQGAQQQFISNSNSTNTATDTTSFAYGAAGSTIPNGATGTAYARTARLNYPYQQGQTIDVEVDQGNGNWVSASQRIGPFIKQNTLNYGILVSPSIGSTDIVVTFQSGGYEPSSTYGTAGTAWSVLSGLGWKWRLVVAQASAPVGFGKASVEAGFGLMAPAKGQYALTVTGTNWTTARAQGIYYQDQDGNHRLKLNLMGTLSSTASTFTGTISGVTFKNLTNYFQAITSYGQEDGVGIRSNVGAYVQPNASTFYVGFNSTVNRITVSADVELESRPTWA